MQSSEQNNPRFIAEKVLYFEADTKHEAREGVYP